MTYFDDDIGGGADWGEHGDEAAVEAGGEGGAGGGAGGGEGGGEGGREGGGEGGGEGGSEGRGEGRAVRMSDMLGLGLDPQARAQEELERRVEARLQELGVGSAFERGNDGRLTHISRNVSRNVSRDASKNVSRSISTHATPTHARLTNGNLANANLPTAGLTKATLTSGTHKSDATTHERLVNGGAAGGAGARGRGAAANMADLAAGCGGASYAAAHAKGCRSALGVGVGWGGVGDATAVSRSRVRQLAFGESERFDEPVWAEATVAEAAEARGAGKGSGSFSSMLASPDHLGDGAYNGHGAARDGAARDGAARDGAAGDFAAGSAAAGDDLLGVDGSCGDSLRLGAFVPRELTNHEEMSNYESALGLLSQADSALQAERQRSARLEIELGELQAAHEVKLHDAQLAQLELRKKVRRLEHASEHADVFELYEAETGQLRAELARARAEVHELECTCRDAALHIETLSGADEPQRSLSPLASRSFASSRASLKASLRASRASSMGAVLEARLQKVRSWRRALESAERDKVKLQEQLAEATRALRFAEPHRKAADAAKRRVLKLSRENERQSQQLLTLQLAKTELAGSKQKLDERASELEAACEAETHRSNDLASKLEHTQRSEARLLFHQRKEALLQRMPRLKEALTSKPEMSLPRRIKFGGHASASELLQRVEAELHAYLGHRHPRVFMLMAKTARELDAMELALQECTAREEELLQILVERLGPVVPGAQPDLEHHDAAPPMAPTALAGRYSSAPRSNGRSSRSHPRSAMLPG